MQVMKSEAELKEGVKVLSKMDGSDLEETQEKLSSVQVKREDLMKRIMHMEVDIANKEKELKKAK